MLHFFSKIRYQLAAENLLPGQAGRAAKPASRIGRYLPYAIGEIPIKGLPRYLAIIQGFIGWFILTIFSVSLISQLLN